MILDFSVKDQLLCCLFSAITGVIFGILYDAVRVIYMIAGIDPHDKKKMNAVPYALVVFFDLAYMAAVSLAFSVVMYAFAFGKFRVAFGICCLAGFILYYRTLSKIVILLFRKLISSVKTALKFILRIILYPIKLSLKYTAVLADLVYSVTLKILISRIKVRLDILHFNKLASNSIDKLIRFQDVSDD